MKEIIYKLLFANQSIDTKKRYKLVRETAMYVFFRRNYERTIIHF